jgi:anti-sigma regulatory factor (Ser/Thr protein kinase)
VSELVTNAMVHGVGPISVEFQRFVDGHLRVIVVDACSDGSAFRVGPAASMSLEHAESGRGLAIVAAVASRWGSACGRDETRVWFELTAR